MSSRSVRLWGGAGAAALLVASVAAGAGTSGAVTTAPSPSAASQRFMVVAKNAADLASLRAKAVAGGARVVSEVAEVGMFVVEGSAAQRAALRADSRTLGVGIDNIRRITQADPGPQRQQAPGLLGARVVKAPGNAVAPDAAVRPDPALTFRGLQWDYPRIGATAAWARTAGSPAVTVGVADTGLDFTHRELASQVRQVVDLANKQLCKRFFTLGGQHVSDEDLARIYGGPARTDWNGHGSWIGGNIAGALNGTGMNGIAPKVGLVALKISQWCGSAFDSEILNAFAYAARNGIDVVSISFGGYLDRSDPDQDSTYRAYQRAVAFASSRGTAIVSSAGNEHVRIGAGGRVISHGPLTAPGDEFGDLYGTYEVPGGIAGVVDVAATNNRVAPSSAGCVPGTTGSASDLNATCKPRSDRHQSPGQGMADQLAYYSNYGPRIDIAAPGGARKFNLPYWDRGGTPGFPFTNEDLTTVWQNFSITSNWALEIPCFTFTRGSAFPPGNCYSSIQGTSMAAPHVSAGLALVASAHPALRGKPAALVQRLKSMAVPRHNLTQVLSATDRSPADLTGAACPTGYCHLGGARISNAEAYGAGLLHVSRP